MSTDINRTTSIALPGDVSSEILQKTQESSAVMSLAQQIKLPAPLWRPDCRILQVR